MIFFFAHLRILKFAFLALGLSFDLKNEPKQLFFDQNKCLLLGIDGDKKSLDRNVEQRLSEIVLHGFIKEREYVKNN